MNYLAKSLQQYGKPPRICQVRVLDLQLYYTLQPAQLKTLKLLLFAKDSKLELGDCLGK